jgi:Zn-dependent protease
MEGPELHGKFVGLVNLMVIVILSTACHEFAHAFLADRFGDPTPRRAGRITFNPFAHVHPIYTVALPAVLYWFGGILMAAAFTPVTVANMRRPRLHGLLTSLGGPVTNLLLAFLALGALGAFLVAAGGVTEASAPGLRNVRAFLAMAVLFNAFIAFFNFLPIPPLDGSDLVAFLLPGRLRASWYENRTYFSMAFLVLLFAGAFDGLLGPVMEGTRLVLEASIAFFNGVARGG